MRRLARRRKIMADPGVGELGSARRLGSLVHIYMYIDTYPAVGELGSARGLAMTSQGSPLL